MARKLKKKAQDSKSTQGKATKKYEKPNRDKESTSSTQKQPPAKQEDGSQQETDDDNATKASKTNDPEWYARDPVLLQNAANMSWSNVLGKKVNIFDVGTYDTIGNFKHGAPSNVTQESLPGIMVLETKPSIGNNSSRYDPANVAATALYTHVRYNNSGRKNYDQADLMMYGLAAADLYAYINWMIRIYNCAYVFSQRNLYIGKPLIEAQHVSASILDDLAAFRYTINVFISKVASYAVPADILLYRKRAFQYANIYTESATGNIKDQLYLYNPAGFYNFELDSEHKSSLAYFSILDDQFDKDSLGFLTLKGLRQIGEKLLYYMWGDEDFGLMSGDILRAFQGNIVTLSLIGDEGGILPVYDEFVLHQIKNSSIVYNTQYGTNIGYNLSLNESTVQFCRNGNVYQDAQGNIVSKELYITYTSPTSEQEALDADHVFNIIRNPVLAIDGENPDPALIAEITRNVVVYSGNTTPVSDNGTINDGLTGMMMDCGDIIVLNAAVYTLTDSGWSKFDIHSNMHHYTASMSQLLQFQKLAQVLGAFKWCPTQIKIVYALNPTTVSIDVQTAVVLSDIWNYAVQKRDVIIRLHEVALLSLLFIPGVARSVSSLTSSEK